MSIFGDLERVMADLYPYRVPITISLLVALAVVLWFAYRSGWHLFVVRHKLASGVVAVALLVVAIPLGNYLLSPLWERSFIEEASPIAVASELGAPTQPGATGDAGAPGAPDAPVAITGVDDFHFGEGTALLIETAPGEYTLRFEDFSVRNGPDLFVYLSPDADGYADGAINLGELKATDGAFNYEIPPDVDVSRFNSAVVWCKQFAVEFASAPLEDV
jgi:hypothetical protein